MHAADFIDQALQFVELRIVVDVPLCAAIDVVGRTGLRPALQSPVDGGRRRGGPHIIRPDNTTVKSEQQQQREKTHHHFAPYEADKRGLRK